MTRIKKYKNKYKYKKTRIHQNAGGGLPKAAKTVVQKAKQVVQAFDTSLVKAAHIGNTAAAKAKNLVRKNPLVNSAFQARTAAEKVLVNTGQNIKNKFISQFDPAKQSIIEAALSNIQKNKVLIAARDEIKRQLKGEVKGKIKEEAEVQIRDFSEEQLEKFFNPQKHNNSRKVNSQNAKVQELVNLMRKSTGNPQNQQNLQKTQTTQNTQSRQNLQKSSIQKPILGINTLGRMFNQSKKNIPTNSKLTLTNNEKREVLKHFLEHKEMYNSTNNAKNNPIDDVN